MIIKLSASGKQLQVVDDDGEVYGTSVTFLRGLLDGKAPKGFVLLTKLPFKVPKGKFAKSPVYNPSSGEKEVDLVDPMGRDARKAAKELVPLGDVKEW